ncbi:MAG: sugar ABC transporter ATP-binding protein [Candidatus Limiplasma sp.]|nr:sugar ABC transporter ATP-binding protein [Candidatus Limiplasma sp.]
MKNITKVFPGAKVLDNACLEVQKGEIMGLIGENGAGKSTILKILTGLYTKTSGTIHFKDREVNYANIDESAQDGIAMMHQELNIFPNLTVAENMFLNRKDYVKKNGFIDKKRIKKDAREMLDALEADIDIEAMGSQLSVHEQQIVEIAKAMSMKAELIIMDEPTAALPENEVATFFAFIRRLNAKGITIIYVSHKMVEIKTICDRVTILRNGQNVDVVNVADVGMEDMINKMVGKTLDEYYVHTSMPGEEVLMKVNHLCGQGFEDVCFELKKSEVLGIYGLAGSGTLELAESLFGAHPIGCGEIELDGQEIKIRNVKQMVGRKVAYVPLDRRHDGFVRNTSIFENISMVGCGYHKKGPFIDWGKNKEICGQFMKSLAIKAVDLYANTSLLSGGNQQKVVLSKWLSIHPRVLILNEPTRGVDVGAKAEIYHLIDHLVKTEDLGIILISSEAPEVLGMTDRVLIMYKGRITAAHPTKSMSQDQLLKYASGGRDA